MSPIMDLYFKLEEFMSDQSVPEKLELTREEVGLIFRIVEGYLEEGKASKPRE